MKLEKINSTKTIDVKIKNIRLPNKDEYPLIKEYSFIYQKGNINFNFYKEFIYDEDKYYKLINKESNYNPTYLSIWDCPVIDLIPIIEINNNIEPNIIYKAYNNIPFMSIANNKLLCLTNIACSYYLLLEEELDYEDNYSLIKNQFEKYIEIN